MPIHKSIRDFVYPQIARVEFRPVWARINPPDLRQIQVGILYTGISDEILTDIEHDEKFERVFAISTVGSAIYHGQSERIISWSDELIDEVAGIRIKERPHPYYMGDRIEIFGRIDSHPTVLRYDRSGVNELILGQSVDLDGLQRAVGDHFDSTTYKFWVI